MRMFKTLVTIIGYKNRQFLISRHFLYNVTRKDKQDKPDFT